VPRRALRERELWRQRARSSALASSGYAGKSVPAIGRRSAAMCGIADSSASASRQRCGKDGIAQPRHFPLAITPANSSEEQQQRERFGRSTQHSARKGKGLACQRLRVARAVGCLEPGARLRAWRRCS
jgi:hypothetical protein